MWRPEPSPPFLECRTNGPMVGRSSVGNSCIGLGEGGDSEGEVGSLVISVNASLEAQLVTGADGGVERFGGRNLLAS
jgi:hypothetical protein